MPKRRRALTTLVLTLALAAGSGAGESWAAPGASVVNATNIAPGHVAWIRSGPGTAYGKVGYLRATSRHVLAMGCKRIARDNWCRVRFRGTRGWIQDRYLRAPHVMTGEAARPTASRPG